MKVMNLKVTKGLNTMTTNNKSRRGQQFGSLKVAVATGGLAAVLLGTQLLGRQEAANNTAVAQPEAVVLNIPANMPTTLQTNQAAAGSALTQRQVTLNLAPIPQAAVPQIRSAPVIRMAPITQTRSSR